MQNEEIKTKLNFRRSHTDEFIEKAKLIHGDKYIYTNVVYVNNTIPVEIVCRTHGSFLQKPSLHLNRKQLRGCQICGREQQVENFHILKCEQNGYLKDHPISGEWDYSKNPPIDNISIGSKIKFWWICKKCDYSWQTTVTKRVDRKHGCARCAGLIVSDSNRFSKLAPATLQAEWFDDRSPDDFSIASAKKVKWKCRNCDYIWTTAISVRTRNKCGCPKCNRSHMERDFQHILNELSIEYTQETVLNGSMLRLDFTFHLDGKLCAVELDGYQHFHEIIWDKATPHKGLDYRQANDKRKNELCLKNRIYLLRIPYIQRKPDILKRCLEVFQRHVSASNELFWMCVGDNDVVRNMYNHLIE
jgi:Zn finger protein HypA/HybF involved in hydrogenase expression